MPAATRATHTFTGRMNVASAGRCHEGLARPRPSTVGTPRERAPIPSLARRLVERPSSSFITAELMSQTGRGDMQGMCFGTIPSAAWWVITSMTTVGYGDCFPISTLGKLIAVGAMLAGIIVLALPITVIGSNFAHATELYEDDAAAFAFQDMDDDGKIAEDELRDFIRTKKREGRLRMDVDNSVRALMAHYDPDGNGWAPHPSPHPSSHHSRSATATGGRLAPCSADSHSLHEPAQTLAQPFRARPTPPGSRSPLVTAGHRWSPLPPLSPLPPPALLSPLPPPALLSRRSFLTMQEFTLLQKEMLVKPKDPVKELRERFGKMSESMECQARRVTAMHVTACDPRTLRG